MKLLLLKTKTECATMEMFRIPIFYFLSDFHVYNAILCFFTHVFVLADVSWPL